MTIAMTTVLPEPVAILAQSAAEFSAVGRYVDAHLPGVRAFGEPDDRLGCFQLAEEEAAGLELLDVGPVLEQSLRDAGYAGVAVPAPRPHPLTDLVYQRDFDELAGIVEALGVLGCSEESGCPPPLREVEQPGLAVVFPVPGRLVIRRVDYEAVYGCLGHRFTSTEHGRQKASTPYWFNLHRLSAKHDPVRFLFQFVSLCLMRCPGCKNWQKLNVCAVAQCLCKLRPCL